MKLKIEIDLDDLISSLFDYEEGQTMALKSAVEQKIIQEVYVKVRDKMESQVNHKMENEVSKMLSDILGGVLTSHITKYVAEEKVFPPKYSRDPKISLEEWVEQKVTERNSYNSLNKLVEVKSDAFVKELRRRYDLLFASNVVAKMKGQGLLKDGVYESIMKSDKDA